MGLFQIIDNTLALIMLLSLVCPTRSEHHSRIVLSPEVHEIVKFVNESFIVTCNPRLDIKLIWLNSRDEMVMERKGRVHVEHIAGGLALVFERILIEDKGEWSCAWIDNRDVRSNFKMIIKQEIYFLDTPLIQVAQEHNCTLIRCMAGGDPVPKISWYFQGLPLNVTNKKYNATEAGLRLCNVSLSDAGEYVCKGYQISASLVKSKERVIRLKVNHKPHFLDTTDTVFAFLNGFATITCNITAEPEANISWHRAGDKLWAVKGVDIHQSSIKILIENASFFGAYKCIATNAIGSAQREYSVRPGLKPKTPSILLLEYPFGNISSGNNKDANAIYLNLSLPMEHPVANVNVTDMDVTGFRVQIISFDNYMQSNGSWINASASDFIYRFDGGTYVLKNQDVARNQIYLLRAATRNVAGLSDYSEPPLQVYLPSLQVGKSASRRQCHGFLFTYLVTYTLYFLVLKWK